MQGKTKFVIKITFRKPKKTGHFFKIYFSIPSPLRRSPPPSPNPSSKPPSLERRAIPVVKIAHQVQLGVVEHVVVHLLRFHLVYQYIDHRLVHDPVSHPVRSVLRPLRDEPKNLGGGISRQLGSLMTWPTGLVSAGKAAGFRLCG